jgi:hypothetical protein
MRQRLAVDLSAREPFREILRFVWVILILGSVSAFWALGGFLACLSITSSF